MSSDHNADQKDSSFLDKPEALRWAGILEHQAHYDGPTDYKHKAAAELRRLHEVNQELLDVINSIYIYANDTLSGRVDGPDDRDWQRAGVVEIRNRARRFATIETAVDAKAAIAKAKGESNE